MQCEICGNAYSIMAYTFLWTHKLKIATERLQTRYWSFTATKNMNYTELLRCAMPKMSLLAVQNELMALYPIAIV